MSVSENIEVVVVIESFLLFSVEYEFFVLFAFIWAWVL